MSVRNANRSVEEIYKKMSPIEHILARPDTYVGSIQNQQENMWVWNREEQRMENRMINYVPGLYKIFDEILVNAADNFQRDPKNMNKIKVDIDKENGYIRVLNNGRGIPIEMHKTHGVYVPELVFGHLLTSDNYDDTQQKLTGGRNGYGAKLTNVFSRKFVVTTASARLGKVYTQVFEKNMSIVNPPKIVSAREDDDPIEDYTEVQFWPDFSKFGMPSGFSEDSMALMSKRVYDMSGIVGSKCNVYLNGKKILVKGFEGYCDLYLRNIYPESGLDGDSMGDAEPAGDGSVTERGPREIPKVYERVADRWEVVVSLSDPKEGNGQFNQVSFVNGICTVKGGTHVNHVLDQFLPKILAKCEAKNKGGLKPQAFQIKNHLWVFVKALIENPAFDSQTKEQLTTRIDQFGSTCVIPDKAVDKIVKLGVVDQVLGFLKSKEEASLKNKLGGSSSAAGGMSRFLGIPKLEDANWAGTKRSSECTLILTEGDSAKALAVAGISVVGRDRFGVFPLKGKPLNVREASFKQTMDNKEVESLLKILGIKPHVQYSDTKGLRYGSVLIMTDQDYDGSHIKGLLINMVHFWWPSLLRVPGFLTEFVTPIVKCSKGSNTMEFFTMTEYEAWKSSAGSNATGWTTKYYKGLGTSTSKEAREMFGRFSRHKIQFQYLDDMDGEAIDMAFNKKRADDRKEWINAYEDGICVDHNVKNLRYMDFVHKELVQFSKYDVARSIPSVVDGLKPSQRKVLYCAFKRNIRQDIKVAQFVGYVSEHSAYHHGEASLEATIVGMAQDFVGSNNLNFLVPSGQFGTRLQGGKDAASARYIYTRLCGHTRAMFHPSDDAVLAYLSEEGQSIEPAWYVPVIPSVLVNGAEGIGTGWSTSVPSYNPKDLVRLFRGYIRGAPLTEPMPYYKGFSGVVAKVSTASIKGTQLPTTASTAVDSQPMSLYGNSGLMDGAASGMTDGASSGMMDESGPMVGLGGDSSSDLRSLSSEVSAAASSSSAAAPCWYEFTGRVSVLDDQSGVEITELPPGTWTQNYKEFLRDMLDESVKPKELATTAANATSAAAKKAKAAKAAAPKGAAAAAKGSAGKAQAKAGATKTARPAGKAQARPVDEEDDDSVDDDEPEEDSDSDFEPKKKKRATVKAPKVNGSADHSSAPIAAGRSAPAATPVSVPVAVPVSSRNEKITIMDIREYHTDRNVHFIVKMKPEMLASAMNAGLEKVFKLRSRASIANMMLFDPRGKIRQYRSAVEIMTQFAQVRLECYAARKNHTLQRLKHELLVLDNKTRFIKLVISGSLVLNNRKLADIIADMTTFGIRSMSYIEGFTKKSQQGAIRIGAAPVALELTESDGQVQSEGKSDFEYVLGMPLVSLTMEKVQKLTGEFTEKLNEIQVLEQTSIEALWDEDLAKLSHAIELSEYESQSAEAKSQSGDSKGSTTNVKQLLMKNSLAAAANANTERKCPKKEFRAEDYVFEGTIRSGLLDAMQIA